MFSDISLLGKSLLFILLNIYLTIDRTGTLRVCILSCVYENDRLPSSNMILCARIPKKCRQFFLKNRCFCKNCSLTYVVQNRFR